MGSQGWEWRYSNILTMALFFKITHFTLLLLEGKFSETPILSMIVGLRQQAGV
jgi:hypothetical protein